MPDGTGKYTFKYELHNVATWEEDDEEWNEDNEDWDEDNEEVDNPEPAYVILTVTNKNGDVLADHVPDKVFMWTYDMCPIDFWKNTD